jgi:twitching motility protein PilT
MATDGTNDGWGIPGAGDPRPIYEIPVTRPGSSDVWSDPSSAPQPEPYSFPDPFEELVRFAQQSAQESAAAAVPPAEPVAPPQPVAPPVSSPVASAQPVYQPAPPPVEPALAAFQPASEPSPSWPAPAPAAPAAAEWPVPSTPVPVPAATAGPEPAFAASAAPAAPLLASEFDTATLTPAERDALEKADAELLAALRAVVNLRASDLHVTVGASPMVRIDGSLTPASSAAVWDHQRTKSALYSLLDDHQRATFERELELDFAFTISANSRFRVNIYQQRGSLGAAFRLIPTEIKGLAELGVPESVAHLAQLPRGLVLVTGPTGSGKSTTLAALIDLVNSTRADHIVTVEDPIEFMHVHKKSIVNQREVGHDTHSFGNALKHVLRQDPDVILIGELRDLETISVALTAAETGHLVFATLHTQDAPQTIDRVIDVFPPHQQQQVRAQLAATLQGVICQTLVKRASGKGRAVATEFLVMTSAIANLIREGKTYQIASAMQAGRNSGMHTMDQHLADLVNNGEITRAAAMEKAHDPEGITRLIQRAESPSDTAARAFAASGPDYGDSHSGVVH